MADEAVSLFKCFYEQGNPNGNHSHLYIQLSMFFVVTSSNFFFSSGFCSSKATPPCSSKMREDGEHVLKISGNSSGDPTNTFFATITCQTSLQNAIYTKVMRLNDNHSLVSNEPTE